MAHLFIKLRWKAFIHGMGSVICLMPGRYATEPRISYSSTVQDDAEAIAGDFRAIGLDLDKAISTDKLNRPAHGIAQQLELFKTDGHGKATATA